MTNRFACALTLCFLSFPLVGCSGGDDDDSATPGSWNGKTYLLAVPKSKWAIPRGIGQDLDGYVPSFIMKISDDGASMMVGAAEANSTPETAVQDLCSPTYTFPFVSAYPKMDLGPVPMKVHVLNPAENMGEDNVQVTGDVFNLTMKDVLPNGSKVSETGVFTATMDFSQLYPLFTALGSGADRDSVCDALKDAYGKYGGECVACPNAAAEPYCLTVEGQQVGAVDASNLSLVEVTEADRPDSCDPVKFQ